MVSLDVLCSFTKVPLRKAIEITLKQINDDPVNKAISSTIPKSD